MTLRYCNTCVIEKPEAMFTKYGNECFECKKLITQNAREKFYKNRVRCVCGLYISDGNPKEKHEQTQKHKDFVNGVKRAPPNYCKNWAEVNKIVKERKEREEAGHYFIDCVCGGMYKAGTFEQHKKDEPMHIEYEKEYEREINSL